MTIHVIICPYRHGTCPADARFCTVHTSRATAHATSPSERIRLSFIGTVLGGVLALLAALANRNHPFDSVVALLLLIGVVQFVRSTMRGQFIAGLRAAVIAVALVVGNAYALDAHDLHCSRYTAGGIASGQ
jgi:uncharacterized membrane protein YccC